MPAPLSTRPCRRHHRLDGTRLRAERDANAELARAQRDDVRDHAVQTDHAEDQRHRRGDAEDRHRERQARDRRIERPPHRPDVEGRQRRIDFVNQRLHGARRDRDVTVRPRNDRHRARDLAVDRVGRRRTPGNTPFASAARRATCRALRRRRQRSCATDPSEACGSACRSPLDPSESWKNVLGRLLADDRLVAVLSLDLIEHSPGDERNSHRAEVAGVRRRVQLERRNLRRASCVALDPHRILIHAVRLERQARRQPDRLSRRAVAPRDP